MECWVCVSIQNSNNTTSSAYSSSTFVFDDELWLELFMLLVAGNRGLLNFWSCLPLSGTIVIFSCWFCSFFVWYKRTNVIHVYSFDFGILAIVIIHRRRLTTMGGGGLSCWWWCCRARSLTLCLGMHKNVSFLVLRFLVGFFSSFVRLQTIF